MSSAPAADHQEFDDGISGGRVLNRLVTRNGVAARLAELHLPE